MFEPGSGHEWDVSATEACLRYVSLQNTRPGEKGKLYLLVRKNRDNSRMRADGSGFFDAPDTSHTEDEIARRVGAMAPVLMLFRQNGRKEKGWKDCPFWWPVIYMPQQMKTVVFASETADAGSSSLMAE